MSKGHHGRVRTRANEQSPDTIPEYEVLEMIIHGVIKQKDVSSVAKALIAEFGSLAQVIDAPIHALCKIEGVGAVSAEYIKKVPYFYYQYRRSKWNNHKIFDNADDIIRFMADRFIGYNNEAVIIMCLDSNLRLLACKPIFEGGIDYVNVNTRKIIDFVISVNAKRVIIAHNHIDGNPEPSSFDKEATRHIYNALSFANVILDDHIIVTDNCCTSLAQSGDIPHLNK